MATAALQKLFRIQYVSDLHLEFYQKLAFPLVVKPVAKYLALAGDIGQPGHPVYNSFLEYVSKNWEHVFYVAGNHEYYQKEKKRWKYSTPSTFFETQASLQESIKPYKNIHFLHHDNPSFYLPKENVAIVGCTLWSHIRPDEYAVALETMNDYNYIPWKDDDGLRPIHPSDISNIFHKESLQLEKQLAYWRTMKAQVCVITHHMPSYSLISQRFQDSPANMCFASHVDSLIRAPVRAWIYGHTHNTSHAVINGACVVANARGYPNEHVSGFLPDAWVEFPTTLDDGSASHSDVAASAVGICPPVHLPTFASGAMEEEVEFV